MLFAACLAPPLAGQAVDSLSASRRVAAASSLAAKEYAGGVPAAGGRLDKPEEVDEAKQFIDQSRFDLPLLPRAVRPYADSALTAFRALLDHLAPPARVRSLADSLERHLAAAAGGALVPMPLTSPSLARGAQVYREQCTACHGDAGHGDGPKARKLTGPPPANLADRGVMGALSPTDIYRKVMLGVAGTAMPAFEESLADSDRWAVTAYVATMPYGGSRTAAVFAAVRRQLDSAVTLRSDKLAFDAYLTFEQVEVDVRVKNDGLTNDLEGTFAKLRSRAAAGASATELTAIHARLLSDLERAERLVADQGSAANLFGQSFLLLLREGFEAILILGALMAFLGQAGAPERRREVAWGAALAVVASGLTALAIELLFHISAGERDALEGATVLLAAGLLFYVSYWLLSKVEADRWHAFINQKMRSALSSGSGFALGSVAFLAVYREGFETILFFKALVSSGGAGSGGAVLAGIVLGGVALGLIYIGINRWGMRVPMRPFFAVTGALLYYMSFVFAGKGIAELQEGGYIGTTVIEWAPRLPFLGIYPTAQSLALQALLLVLAAVALVWFVVRRAPAAPPRG